MKLPALAVLLVLAIAEAVPVVHPEDTPIRFFRLSVSLAPAE